MKISILFVLILCFILSACQQDFNCISGDDFGNIIHNYINSYASEGSDFFISDDGDSGEVEDGYHAIRWEETGLVTSSNKIYLEIDGEWIASSAKDGENTSLDKEKICKSSDMIDAGTYFNTSESCTTVSNICWMNNGYGAYFLFQRPGEPSPNRDFDLILNPVSPTLHLYDVNGKSAFTITYAYESDGTKIDIESGWKIYAKIYDYYYYDNAGKYQITYKTGIRDADEDIQIGVFETLRRMISGYIEESAELIFKVLISDSVIYRLLTGLLTIHIMVLGLSYLMGLSNNPQEIFLKSFFKILLLLIVFSTNGWEMLYNTYFSIFLDGLPTIIGIINGAALDNFNPDAPFNFMDDYIFDYLFGKYIWSYKIPALIIGDIKGLFLTPMIFIICLGATMILLYAFVVYMISIMAITLIIGITPILFLGILFAQIKVMFENSIKLIIGFSFQAIMMFLIVALVFNMVFYYFNRIMGFKVCYGTFFTFSMCTVADNCWDILSLRGYVPSDNFTPHKLSPFLITSDFKTPRYAFSKEGAYIAVPPKYDTMDYRLIDLPFLNPNIQNSQEIDFNYYPPITQGDVDYDKYGDDAYIISEIFKGNLVSLVDSFMVAIVIILLWTMKNTITMMGSSIAGTSPFGINITNALDSGKIGQFFNALFTSLPFSTSYVIGNAVLGGTKKIARKGASMVGNVTRKASDKIIGEEKTDNITQKTRSTLKLGSKVMTKASSIGYESMMLLGLESEIQQEYNQKFAFRRVDNARAQLNYTFNNVPKDYLKTSVQAIDYKLHGLNIGGGEHRDTQSFATHFVEQKAITVNERLNIKEHFLGQEVFNVDRRINTEIEQMDDTRHLEDLINDDESVEVDSVTDNLLNELQRVESVVDDTRNLEDLSENNNSIDNSDNTDVSYSSENIIDEDERNDN